MYSQRTKKILELAKENYPSSSESEPDNVLLGGDDFSDDPNYSTTDESTDSEEFIPEKRARYEGDNDDAVLTGPGPSTAHIAPRISEPFDVAWSDPAGRNQVFTFTLQPTIKPDVIPSLSEVSPRSVYDFFVDSELLDLMVHETNRYADQVIVAGILDESIGPSSRVNDWVPTDRTEMIRFLALVGYMGIVPLANLRDYWCNRFLLKSEVCRSVMPRNRFEILLKMWHFSNNEEESDSRVRKLKPLIDHLNLKFQNICTPGETVCVDESMIPYRGRLNIRQYMPNKTHKYGVKVFKLCCNKGFTWNFKIYEGREKKEGGSVPTNVVMELTDGLLGEGRTIVTDNYYTSIDLALKLLQRKTHSLGTLRKNRKYLPKEVVEAKLKKGEVRAMESEEGILVLKWKDKRDVLALSTKHGPEVLPIATRAGSINKPKLILNYNEGKAHIDISDQMSSYNTSLRRSVRWYKKIAIELLFGMTLVNSHIIFKELSGVKMTISRYKEYLVENLIKSTEPKAIERPQPTRPRHCISVIEGGSQMRKGCKGCKQKSMDKIIHKNKIKKVTTYCPQCPGEPFYCRPCYAEAHK